MSPLAVALEQETSLLIRFIAVLEKEQDALKHGWSDQLGPICEEKLTLIGYLNTAEATRGQILDSHGDDLQAETLQWLQAHPDDRIANALWQKMRDLARNAKHLHELNSRLVQMHLKKTDELLSILTRKAEQNTFYSSNGQAHSVTGSRLVDSA
ncbi:MAG: flagellar protein FlgN [Rhodocyclales bacterium GT-UBC]|nr:MAG: flagellar protein FlgN [Rhodocyclales bacterium GT-UBC]